jgi:pentapeptide MXKDX repeat protein
MRNTKLILAMLAGCTVMSGAAFAQDSMKKDPTPAASTATPTQTSSDAMKSGDSMKSDSKTESGGAMKSTHKKAHKKATDEAAPAKASTAGM